LEQTTPMDIILDLECAGLDILLLLLLFWFWLDEKTTDWNFDVFGGEEETRLKSA
jgi:hypothetical protein